MFLHTNKSKTKEKKNTQAHICAGGREFQLAWNYQRRCYLTLFNIQLILFNTIWYSLILGSLAGSLAGFLAGSLVFSLVFPLRVGWQKHVGACPGFPDVFTASGCFNSRWPPDVLTASGCFSSLCPDFLG